MTAELRNIAGLGTNPMQVYQDAKCYLKGVFNAIEAFRSERDPEGWRVESLIDSAAFLEYSHENGLESPLDVQGDYPLQQRLCQSCFFMLKRYKCFSKESNL